MTLLDRLALRWRRFLRHQLRKWSYVANLDPPPAADPPGTAAPIHLENGPLPSATAGGIPTVSFRGIVKQSMTKKSRMDLSAEMVSMCTLTGWQGTTLNPDMGDEAKLAILANRYGKLASEDDPAALYTELIRLSAASMGWAQGIARREMRDRKRRSRERKRIRKEERKRAKRRAKRDGKRPVETVKTTKT